MKQILSNEIYPTVCKQVFSGKLLASVFEAKITPKS